MSIYTSMLSTALILSSFINTPIYADGHGHDHIYVTWSRSTKILGGESGMKKALTLVKKMRAIAKEYKTNLHIYHPISGNPYTITLYIEEESMDTIVKKGEEMRKSPEFKALLKEMEASGVFSETYDAWGVLEE